MACHSEAHIQAYLDGELSRDARKELARHLEHCQTCRTKLADLKRLMEWTDAALAETLLSAKPDAAFEEKIDVDAAWQRFEQKLSARAANTTKQVEQQAKQQVPHPLAVQRRWSTMAKTYQKWLVGTAAAVVVGASLMIPQVQAAASDFLSMFRVEKFATVKITQEDLNNIKNFVSSGRNGEMDLNGIGKVTMEGKEGRQSRNFQSVAEAKAVGYTPAQAPGGFKFSTLDVSPGGTMNLQIDTTKANKLLKQLGSDVTFDDKLNGKKFSITIPEELSTNFEATAENFHLRYTVSDTPHLEVPAGVDVKQLRDTVLKLPFVPQEVARQLASIDDWQNTLPVPYIEGQSEAQKVQVGSAEGMLVADKNHINTMLLWQKNGKLYRLEAFGQHLTAEHVNDTLLRLAKFYNN